MATGKIYIKDNSGNVTEFKHQHTTEEVTSLNGYVIATAAGAVNATDSLNVALGKIQKSIDGKQASLGNMSSAEANTGTATTARAISAKVLNDKIVSMIPDVTVSTSGSGDAVVSVSATNHSITVTKGGSFATTGHNHDGTYLKSISGTNTGTGNAVTAISVTNGTVTATKGITFSTEGHTHNYSATGHKHVAADVTSGTFDAARIPNLDASKIASGTISIDRLPAAALERLVTVTNEAARFALTTANVQKGDSVKQTDTGVMYIVVDDTKLNTADGYVEYSAGTASRALVADAVSWTNVTGRPTIPTIPNLSITTSGSGNGISSVTVSGHAITVTKTDFTTGAHPTIPNLSVTTSGTGTLVTGLTVSGHAITIAKGTSIPTIPTIPNITMATSTHTGQAVDAITASGHTITMQKGFTETQLSLATSTHTGTVLTDLQVSNHKITMVKGASIPSIPNLSVSTSGTGNGVNGLTVSGHTITISKTDFTTGAHPTIPNITVNLTTTVTGANAITAISATNHTITATLGKKFSEDGHTHSYMGSVEVSGTGNAITTASFASNKLTLTKGVTFSTDGHTHSYLPLTGGTITGNLIRKNTAKTRGTAPTANVNVVEVYGQDSAGKTTWGIYNTYSTTKQNQVQLIAYNGLTTDNTWAGIGVGYDASGNVFTNAPNPATSDSSSKIATTKFVKDQGYAAGTHTHTFPTLSISTSTHGGNAVTAVSVSNHAITITKGSTFLTSQTQLSVSTSGTGNCVSALTVSNHAITITKGVTALTSHQSLSGYVPTSRTVNGKALSANISLTASDVGALASTGKAANSTLWNGHPFGWGTGAKTAGSTDTANASMIYFQYVN